MAKKDDLVKQLLERVEQLTAEVDALKQQPAKAPKESKKGLPRENVIYEVKSCLSEGQPPQCLTLSKWAYEAQKEIGRPMKETELYGAFELHKAEWRHRQSIWHVWQYYRARLIGAGVLKMN